MNPAINELLPRDELEHMSRRDRKKQETRWRIYDAAIDLFTERGFEEVKIEEICQAADVSNAAFFHHFSTKASLISAYLDRLKARIRDQLAKIPDATSTEKLKEISRQVKLAAESSASFGSQMTDAITAETRKVDVERIDTGISGALAQILRDGQASGEFSRSWHAELVAVTLVGAWLLLPQAQRSVDFPKNSHDELLELILFGLRS